MGKRGDRRKESAVVLERVLREGGIDLPLMVVGASAEQGEGLRMVWVCHPFIDSQLREDQRGELSAVMQGLCDFLVEVGCQAEGGKEAAADPDQAEGGKEAAADPDQAERGGSAPPSV